MKSRLSLNISSWAVFAVSLTLYWITCDPGVSYWDCPEYVTVASRMEVGHPPGNPIWMLAMRVATIPFPVHLHAYVINLCSGLLMAFATFFLCRLIFMGVEKLQKRYSSDRAILSGIISFGASLTFALCDSAWYSAVEAEVYAMSAFLSALSLWLMAIWSFEKSTGRRTRILILLAYITGLSLGVHQLNLLLIPVFTLIVFYKYHPRKTNPMWVIFWILVSCCGIGVILMGVIPGVLFGAGAFELLSVNRLGWPYHSGVIIFSLLIFILIIINLGLTENLHRIGLKKKSSLRNKALNLNTAVWALAFILLGFSSFGIILIRGNAYPPMNQGVPDNIFALSSYIQREQYPSAPLLYGNTPYSRPMFEETFVDGKPVYSRYILKKGKARYDRAVKGGHFNHRSGMLSSEDSADNRRVAEKGVGYVLTDYKFSQRLTPELDMWLPRITSRKTADRAAYADWADMTEESMLRIPISETIDSAGNPATRMYLSSASGSSRPEVMSYRPTYWQNFRFFIAYQSYYMYFRYLFWNFIGRQNDYPSMGEIEHGNFITGLPFVDSYLGVKDTNPPEIGENNPGRNRYFGLPFLFGVIGIIYLSIAGRRPRRLLTLIALLFVMTSIAIVAYLNQSPGEPRERDYTFLVSYMAFAMWIAAGVFGCVARLRKGRLIMAAVLSLGLPSLMAAENFNDHDRRGRYETEFYVSSLLDFELPAIIFTQGDNSTFPLWYATEVIPQTISHTPVDVTYLSLPSYVINLKKQGERGITTISTTPQIAYDGFILTQIPQSSSCNPLPLTEALDSLYSAGLRGGGYPQFPVSHVTIPSSGGDSVTINLREFTSGSSFIQLRHLMLLDILASQLRSPDPRPLFFPYLIDAAFYKPLKPALQSLPFGEIYAPWLPDSVINRLYETSVGREITKLSRLPRNDHYVDPVVADRSRRYRGELIIAADRLMQLGDTSLAIHTVEELLDVLPYEKVLPGSFTISDSTFYEGKAALALLDTLRQNRNEPWLNEKYRALDSLVSSRRLQWLRYYNSLSPEQRATLSARSRRLML